MTANRVDWEESGAKAAVGNTTTIADGGYLGTGLLMLHRRREGEGLPERSQAHNKFHKQRRARVEHDFAQMTWLSGELTDVTKRVTACEKASGSSR